MATIPLWREQSASPSAEYQLGQSPRRILKTPSDRTKAGRSSASQIRHCAFGITATVDRFILGVLTVQR
jgi:hypothetical protein